MYPYIKEASVAISKRSVNRLLVGRLAEALIESLFRASGLPLHRFGFEWTLQNLITDHKMIEVYGSLPDFRLPKSMGFEYIEVKFRIKGILEEDTLQRLRQNPFEPTLILIQLEELTGVSEAIAKGRIRVMHYPYEEAPGRPGLVRSLPIDQIRKWELDPHQLRHCEKLVVELFTPICTSIDQ